VSDGIRGITEAQARLAIPDRGWLKAYVKWGEGACDANIAYHIFAGLSVLTQSVPHDYHVPFGAERVYVPLYSLLVGDSTDARKSTVVKQALRITRAALPDRVGAEPGSSEAVVDELFYKPQQIVFITEYGATLASAEKSYATAIKTKWTQAYDMAPLGRVKANKKGVVVDAPRLSILAGCTPDYVERFTEPVDWTGGFMARHTTILANRERHIVNPVADADLENRLIEWLKAVAKVDAYSAEASVGPCLGISPDAVRMRAAWSKKLDAIEKLGRNKSIAPAIHRGDTMTLKIAALLAWDWGVSRTGGSWEVTGELMAAAITIVDLHVQSVVEIGSWLAADKMMRWRRDVLALIDKKPTHRGHVIRESNLTKRDFDNIIGTLLDERTISSAVIDSETYYARASGVFAKHADRPETRPDPSDVTLDDEPSPFNDTMPPPVEESGIEGDFGDPTLYD
jgi:hypothetical protein